MTKDKKFILDSIKMNLYRVVTATGDITKEVPPESVKAFFGACRQGF
jgi:hypothetical protein